MPKKNDFSGRKPEQEKRMKVITLKQISSQSHVSNSLHELEVGNTIDGYEVVEIEEKECEHPEFHWKLDNKSSATNPEVTGTCRVCGEKKTLYTTSHKPLPEGYDRDDTE